MAARNLGRDRKRVISVLVSLTFGGLLLVVSASVFGSYSPEQDANAKFPYGHFRLYLDDPELNSYEQMKDSPFTEDFKQELLSINGVEQVQTLRRSVGGSDFKGETSEGGGRCDILTKEGLSLEGDWDYVAQHLTSGRMPENDREILIADAYANNPDSNNFIRLGEEIELETEEDTMTVTMVGTYGKPGSSNGTYALDSAAVMITEGLAREMISSVENFDYTWVISADPNKEDSVTAALESVATKCAFRHGALYLCRGTGLFDLTAGCDFWRASGVILDDFPLWRGQSGQHDPLEPTFPPPGTLYDALRGHDQTAALSGADSGRDVLCSVQRRDRTGGRNPRGDWDLPLDG